MNVCGFVLPGSIFFNKYNTTCHAVYFIGWKCHQERLYTFIHSLRVWYLIYYSKPPAGAIPQKLVNITNVKGLLNDYPTNSQVVNKWFIILMYILCCLMIRVDDPHLIKKYLHKIDSLNITIHRHTNVKISWELSTNAIY